MASQLIDHPHEPNQAIPSSTPRLSEAPPTSPQVRSSWRPMWLSLLFIATAGGAYLFGTMQSHDAEKTSPISNLPPADAKNTTGQVFVTAETVQSQPIQRSVDAVGTLFGYEEVTVSSKVEGRVAKIVHDLSSIVKPGEPLLLLDETDAKLAVEQATKSVQAELAKWGFTEVPTEQTDLTKLPTVVSAKLRFDLARSRLERMLPLQASKSISEDDLEQAKSDARVMESDYQNQLLMAGSAAATARLRKADLDIALQRLADCTIRVPQPFLHANTNELLYAVSERLVSEGTLVRPGNEVFRLVYGQTLKLRLPIPEAYAGRIQVGQHVELDTRSSHSAQGIVARISPAVDRSTRTFMVEAEVPNPQGLLKPGSFAKARILVDKTDQAFTVSHSAVYSFAGLHKIFVLEGNQVREVKVTLGDQSPAWIEITSPPLTPTTQVISSGQRLLSDGMQVSLRETPTSQATLPSTGDR